MLIWYYLCSPLITLKNLFFVSKKIGFIFLRLQSAALTEPLLCVLTLSFSRLIESSLGSVATKFNFFIHNLAQLRFSGLPSNDEPILSFSAKTYSLKQDGRIKQVSVFTYQKRYNPDKHYVSMWELFPLREDNGAFSSNKTQQGQLTKTSQRDIPQCIMSLSAIKTGGTGDRTGLSSKVAVWELAEHGSTCGLWWLCCVTFPPQNCLNLSPQIFSLLFLFSPLSHWWGGGSEQAAVWVLSCWPG